MGNGLQKIYEYLFLDIEWNQKEGTTDVANREPVQIGIIATDRNLSFEKTMSKAICVEDVNTLTGETCRLIHATKETVMQGKPEPEVFEKVRQSFPNYRYVVVWSRETYAVFRESMRRSCLKVPKHTVLVLQDIVQEIARTSYEHLRFKIALIKAGIAFKENYLHYAKQDVKYLYELFKYLYLEYTNITEQETAVVNEQSKIIHAPDCRHAGREASEELLNAKSLIFSGYRPCMCCKARGEWKRLAWDVKIEPNHTGGTNQKSREQINMKALPLTDENIIRICERFGLTCNIVANVVSLRTSIGTWRICLSGDKVSKVYHGNYRSRRSELYERKCKYNKGYHVQDVNTNNFYEVVKYIFCHDKNQYNKHRFKKSRMEYLFEKIEQEMAGGEE